MIVTRHVYHTGQTYVDFIPGIVAVMLGVLMHYLAHPIMSLFLIAIGVVAASLPFFKYLISAYRSLIIDFDSQTLLFRSGYSRAHRFCDIVEIKIEFDNSQGSSKFLIILYFDQHKKEELFELTMTDDDIDKRIFDIKDYFESRFQHNKFNYKNGENE